VRGQDVFIVQPLSTPVSRSIMELLIMLDTVKRASAGRITAVVPYYAYARTDKKDQPRVPITARLIADLITVAGANRVLTLDLHSGQIQGFFSIPVDELTALHLLGGYFAGKILDNPVVVAADIGAAKRARDFAAKLDASFAIINKRRVGNRGQTEALNIIGDVAGCTAIIMDDEIDTAGLRHPPCPLRAGSGAAPPGQFPGDRGNGYHPHPTREAPTHHDRPVCCPSPG